jgi:hypothetical protein
LKVFLKVQEQGKKVISDSADWLTVVFAVSVAIATKRLYTSGNKTAMPFNSTLPTNLITSFKAVLR